MVDGCKTQRMRKGFCQKHMPDSERIYCALDGCATQAIGNGGGFCTKHCPKDLKARILTRCSKKGCNTPVRRHGVCYKHLPYSEKQKLKKVCIVDGCDTTATSNQNNMCLFHYNRRNKKSIS
jgi:hypothetical protein